MLLKRADRLHVLLVDDEEEQYVLINEYLRRSRADTFTLTWAGSFDHGIRLLREPQHDVVLLDQGLGPNSGLELLECVPNVATRLPVILLTGRNTPDIDTVACRRGVLDFLDKDALTAPLLERSICYAMSNFRIQKELREAKARFEGLYNGVFEGIIVHDGEFVLDTNAAFLNMMGLARVEVVGRPLFNLFDAAKIPMVLETAGDSQPLELTLVTKDRCFLAAEVRSRPHFYNGAAAYLTAIRDVTGQRRAERELRETNASLEERVAQRTQELQRSNNDLQRFAHIIAHDIQLPLRTVSRHIHQVRDQAGDTAPQCDCDDSLRCFFLDRAIQAVERLQEMVHGVLAYSCLSVEKMSIQSIDLNALLRDVMLDLSESIEEAHAIIRVVDLPVIQADRPLMESLFRNLLQNALKYRSRRAPFVDVTVNTQGPYWVFTVRDNGIGFCPEEAEKIFSMFHRADAARERPGTGLGLTSCKRIVELHGGRIWATAKPDDGAVFHFTLPKEELPAQPSSDEVRRIS